MNEPRVRRNGCRSKTRWFAVAASASLLACSVVVDDPLPGGAGSGGSDPGGSGQAQNGAGTGSSSIVPQQNAAGSGSDEPPTAEAGGSAPSTSGAGGNGSAGTTGSDEAGNGSAGSDAAGGTGGTDEPAGAGGGAGSDGGGSGSSGSGAAGTGSADDSCAAPEDCVLCTTPISDAMPCCDGCPQAMSAKRCEEIAAARKACTNNRIAICPIPLCVFPGQPQCEAGMCVPGDGLAQ